MPGDVVIVGAGAAGLATAIFTRRLAPSLPVVLVEGAVRPGAKILVSGGSRCNVTNAIVTEQDFWGGRRTIVRRVLGALSVAETIAFFKEIGVALHEEAHGKLFPDTNRSRDVLAALLSEAERCGVRLEAGTRVHDLDRTGAGWRVQTARGAIDAGAVVLATGGASLPKSGSDGAGIEIARRLGHTIVPMTPALVPLVLADEPNTFHRALTGVSHDAELSVWIGARAAIRLRGALLWTHFGVSGPVALDVSRHWLRGRLEGRDVRLTVNFIPGARFEDVEARWTDLATTRPRLSVHAALASDLPAAVATALLAALEIDGAITLARLTRDTRRRLSHALVSRPLPVVSSRGYSYAEATAGGVALEEIDSSTMASRRCAQLYLVGEMLDIDGRIGGFNFQWAWASARVAATALSFL
jgi:predicted Rossmann fold flavoprotein